MVLRSVANYNAFVRVKALPIDMAQSVRTCTVSYRILTSLHVHVPRSNGSAKFLLKSSATKIVQSRVLSGLCLFCKGLSILTARLVAEHR